MLDAISPSRSFLVCRQARPQLLLTALRFSIFTSVCDIIQSRSRWNIIQNRHQGTLRAPTSSCSSFVVSTLQAVHQHTWSKKKKNLTELWSLNIYKVLAKKLPDFNSIPLAVCAEAFEAQSGPCCPWSREHERAACGELNPAKFH